ncbi:hypothetical protein DAX92_26970 [Salmonella enterica subsp. enterica]|uniref:Uncharacterized protein n=2 Tax=Salmonella enterica TaxID=28901 RepID=A0A7Z1TGP8_SALET|nr:hypothetical protein [Salmonella enterica]EMD8701615.1 hypothetical protein [Salmonella enterica]PUF26186.1 hypothetical protein DAX92_26970 [Salmonella enterica subsp. enterica]PUF49625.1 hypothetical protein DAX73_28290 [Salmonella enterica subsp. enterica]
MAKGGERFCVSVTAYGEAVLYWTNAKGVRVWRVLSGNRGKRPCEPSGSTKKKIAAFRHWLSELMEVNLQ